MAKATPVTETIRRVILRAAIEEAQEPHSAELSGVVVERLRQRHGIRVTEATVDAVVFRALDAYKAAWDHLSSNAELAVRDSKRIVRERTTEAL